MRLSHGTALFATVGILAAGHIACSGSADEGPAERPKSQEQGERPVSQYYQEEVKPDIVWKAAEGTFGASLSLDGSAVVTADVANGRLVVWNAHDGSRTADIGTHEGVYYAMVSADGRFIASHGDDGMILVWALSQTGEPIAEIEVGEYNPYISFAPYSATFAYATEEGFGVFDCEEKKEIASTKHAMPGEFRLRFDTDPRFVVVIDISEDHVGIFLWEWQRSNRVHNVQEPRQITGIVRTLTAGKIMYQTLDFDPNSGLSTTLVVLDLDTLKTEDIATIETGAYLLAFQVYDASGRHISIAHYPGKPTKLAVGDQSLTTYIVAQPEHELRVGVGRAGKVFIAAGDDGYVRLWRE